MKKEKLTQKDAENSPSGGVVVGKRNGQTMVYDDASVGGYFVGKLHSEGGIKMVNKSTGQPLEVQGSEVIITAPAVNDNTKREFQGKMMTNREILSKINSDGGGVSFADGGEMPKSIKHTGASYKYGGKTMTDHEIMTSMNKGGHLAEGFSLRDIADIHQVPLAELKKQVRLGMEAESEHTSSKREQMKIVKDHLFENPEYYTLLKKVGLKKGGEVESLVKDAKSGNSPSRDLNNYNDLLDVQTDGAVGAETGLFADGGEVGSKYMMGDDEVYIGKAEGIALNDEVCLFYGKDKTMIKCISRNQLDKYVNEGKLKPLKNTETEPQPSSTHTIQPDGWGVSKYRDGKEIYKKSDKNYSQEILRSKSGEVSLSTIVLDSIHGEVGNRTYSDMKHKDFDTVEEAKNYVAENYDKMEVKKENEISDNASSSIVTNWNEVPSIWKDTSKVKKVTWSNNPYDKGLYSIIAPFLGKDDTRPVFTGINFDENGITVTNGHILITLPYPNKEFEGVYNSDLSKKKDENQITIEGNYPNYPAVIPTQEDTTPYLVDVYKLLQYSNVAEKYSNQYTKNVVFKVGDFGFSSSARILNLVLNSLLKLGHEKVYAHYTSPNRAIVFTTSKNYTLGNDEILLLMPTHRGDAPIGAEDIDYGRKISVYYDFNDNEIHNADGSVADFKMNYASNLAIDKEDVNLLEKLANGKNRLQILNYVLVKNGVASATDLETQYNINGVELPNGIYKPNKGALEITMEAIEDFPTDWKFEVDDDTIEFAISSDVFEYYIDKMQFIVGKDDLRPIMRGVCLHHTSDNQLFLAGTDAHLLLKINITEYVDMPIYNKEIKTVIQPINLYNFLNSTEHTALKIQSNKSNTVISNGDRSFYCRNLDGNYPNYDAVIQTYSTKLAIVSLDKLRKAIDSDLAKSYLKENRDGSFIFNKENDVFIAMHKSRQNTRDDLEIEKSDKLCEANVDYKEEQFYKGDKSLLLVMPVMSDQQTNFAFGVKIFQRVLKVVNDNKLELHYTEFNRAYLVPIHSFDFKKTTVEHKVKEQKPTVEEKQIMSSISEIDEIKEAIETLEMLSEMANRKDKKEINEAIEVLQMLLDTYDY